MPSEAERKEAFVWRAPSTEKILPKLLGQKYAFWITLLHVPKERITEDYEFMLPDGRSGILPKDFVFDGASFPVWLQPLVQTLLLLLLGFYLNWWIAYVISMFVVNRFFWVIFNRRGLAYIPGAVHDFLFRHHYLPLKEGGRAYEGCSLFAADDLFKRIHVLVNDRALAAWITYRGLQLGSKGVWKGYRDKIDLTKKLEPPSV